MTPRSLIRNLVALCAIGVAPTAFADHVAREDPSEPIFTERSFVEKNLEFDLGFEHGADGDDVAEPNLGFTWVFDRRFQVGLEIPMQIRVPEHGARNAALGDVGISAQWLLCCDRGVGWTFVSLRTDVAAPTGDRGKGIDGNGAFGFSLLAGHGFTLARALDDLGVQVEFAYQSEIRLDDEARAMAASLGHPMRREQALRWNLAFSQPLFGGLLTPVLEVLGTTVLAAVDPADRTTRVELAAGVWAAPFADNGAFSAASMALGVRLPVTSAKEVDVATLLILEWAFD